MSSIYKDDFYESLDFISQATEPFVDNVENLYSMIPSSFTVTKKDIQDGSTMSPRYASIDIDKIQNAALVRVVVDIMQKDFSKYKTDLTEFFSSYSNFKNYFYLDLKEDTEINIFTSESNYPITIFKKQNTINNDELLDYAKKRIYSHARWANFGWGKYNDRKRIIEVCDIFSLDNSFTKTKDNKKIASNLCNHIYENIKNDVYRIRTYKLMKSIAEWCDAYVEKGDLSAYTNLTKFKLMTHSGRAIYSIEEAE